MTETVPSDPVAPPSPTRRVPLVMMVVPEEVLSPVMVSVPAPLMIMVPVPLMIPA